MTKNLLTELRKIVRDIDWENWWLDESHRKEIFERTERVVKK